jgi:hypothetical protein
MEENEKLRMLTTNNSSPMGRIAASKRYSFIRYFSITKRDFPANTPSYSDHPTGRNLSGQIISVVYLSLSQDNGNIKASKCLTGEIG